MLKQYHFDVTTTGRGFVDITSRVSQFISEAAFKTGLCHVFLHHTSASLCLCENYDPLVQQDLETFMSRLVPDGDQSFQHIAEGPDDMPSHVRTIITSSFITVPVTEHKIALGKWQGIYLWEHRLRSHHRKLTITIFGE